MGKRHALESYAYHLRNTLNDEGIADKISDEDKERIEEAVAQTLDWLDENEDAEVEDFKEKHEELEGIANPVISKIYKQSSAGDDASRGDEFDEEDGEDDVDFEDDL